MELTIEVPERVVARAAELGVPVETLVSRALEGIGEKPTGNGEEALPPGFRWLRGSAKPKMSREEAGAVIRNIAKRHTLGGLKIKDLIEEGRRG